MKKKVISLTIIITMVTVLTPIDNFNVYAANNSNKEKIESNKEKISDLEKEKNNIKEKKKEQESELDSLMKEIEEKSLQLTKSENTLKKYENEVQRLNKEVDKINTEISTNEKEIVQNEEEAKNTEELLENRLRSYYKANFQSQYLYMIFSSKSIGELFSNIFNVNKIIKTDNELLKEIKELHKELEEKKETLNNKKIKVQNAKKEQEELKQKSKVEKDKHEAEVNKLKSLEHEKEIKINKLSSEEKNVKSKIEDLLSYNAELQNEINKIFNEINNNNSGSNNNNNSNSDLSNNNKPNESGFMVPTVGPITSSYGPRVHPVTGANGFHTGVDYGASHGAPIKASKSGTVVTAGWMSGYGKTVIIDHGNGKQTLYAHSSELLVSAGQKVSGGQVIAKVGSTGMSTGAHLHFEIRINGNHTDPMRYL
ncbi:peptidoglycan DD-metalloendopeptidase family protein [Clostridium sardiniense]|uniref:Peptidoglycan DD-metalloendopeptidase family protein n=1 Tax=Clostridium sardiniense TaxID=29369 RepID=A0ABS7KX59_CLOSR|nr:M23 family metallopeptidase [Clostridium sardiniense]MBY0755193.1 peptidoglycan DD-metalloendopeptidase family protein [Clostridium sardiniense]MDQ0461141.1 murein DD-endopeptidase MepM/ murein hydrolase activator NlpD [Clostridium sardiniense]